MLFALARSVAKITSSGCGLFSRRCLSATNINMSNVKKQSKISSFFSKSFTPGEEGSPVKSNGNGETNGKSKKPALTYGKAKSSVNRTSPAADDKDEEDTRKRKSSSVCESPESIKSKGSKKVKRTIIYSDSEEDGSDGEWKTFKPEATEAAVEQTKNKGLSDSSPDKKSADVKNEKSPSPEKKPSPGTSSKSNKNSKKTETKKPVKNLFAKKDSGKKKEDKEEKSPPTKKTEQKKERSPSVEKKKDSKESSLSPAKNGDKNKDSSASPDAVKKVSQPVVPTKQWNNDYDPSVNNYHPINDASWTRGQSVPYLALARTLEKIEDISSRLKIVDTLANYLRSVILLSPHDLLPSLYLCLNRLAPAYEGVELGIAETNLMKAISQATGRPLSKIKEDVATKGDLGLVAEASRSNQKTLFTPQPLSVAKVFIKLKEIASLTGQASTQKKIGLIQSMLVACKHSEARYLVRSLAGKLRIGLAEQSLLQALAQACFLTPPNQNQADSDIEWPPKAKLLNAGKGLSADEIKSRVEKVAFVLKSCYCECPNYDKLVDILLKYGIDELEQHCMLTPGIPPRPMLAQPTKGVEDVLQRFTGVSFTCEYKYDGERAQIHLLENGDIKIFSRNQEDNTLKYPDVVSRFKECIGPDVTSCIVDSEVVAWDREKESILPFQVLSTRKRKDAVEADIKVQVLIFAFDLIYLNGQSLVKEPLTKRRELLRGNFKEVKGQFGFATSLDTDSMEEVHEFLEESIKGNCEGLMVKTLHINASYELAKRSQKWLKLKKDYLATGGDSLDLVVIGGFLGKGKRTGVYGGYLLACYDPDNEEFQTICKLGTGFSDEQLEKHAEALKEHVIPKPKPYYRFHSNLTPDHWFDAVLVWEVKCADLSLSPVHTAAAGIEDAERGISLRFPRFLRIRDDKNAEDATSASQVAQMYKNQDVVKNNATTTIEEIEDDFY